MKIETKFLEMKIAWLAFTSSFLSTLSVVKAEFEQFIVEGDYTTIAKYPHSAFLAIKCHKQGNIEGWSCGASIINQNILLTAAHCLSPCSQSSIVRVIVGATNKKEGQSNTAKSFKSHEGYKERKSVNDIALLYLKKPLIYSDAVKRLALSRKSPIYEAAAVAGWGLIDEHTKAGTLILKETKQKVLSKKECIKILKYMNDNNICTESGYENEPKLGYASKGDSGSALVVRGYIQIGIVSYKIPRLAPDIVVFTHVDKFIDWINGTMSDLYCDTTP